MIILFDDQLCQEYLLPTIIKIRYISSQVTVDNVGDPFLRHSELIK